MPCPTDRASFWKLVKLNREIRENHLLESPAVEKLHPRNILLVAIIIVVLAETERLMKKADKILLKE